MNFVLSHLVYYSDSELVQIQSEIDSWRNQIERELKLRHPINQLPSYLHGYLPFNLDINNESDKVKSLLANTIVKYEQDTDSCYFNVNNTLSIHIKLINSPNNQQLLIWFQNSTDYQLNKNANKNTNKNSWVKIYHEQNMNLNKHSHIKTSCLGCQEQQPNQLAHCQEGGCLQSTISVQPTSSVQPTGSTQSVTYYLQTDCFYYYEFYQMCGLLKMETFESESFICALVRYFLTRKANS